MKNDCDECTYHLCDKFVAMKKEIIWSRLEIKRLRSLLCDDKNKTLPIKMIRHEDGYCEFI